MMYVTKGVSELLDKDKKFSKEVNKCMGRFYDRDWGDICKEDKKLNDNADILKERIVARYNIKPKAIYIITEWDKSSTTVLFTEEY